MSKHITCMGKDIQLGQECGNNIIDPSHVCFHALLNSLCNSGNNPLVNITIPVYTCKLQYNYVYRQYRDLQHTEMAGTIDQLYTAQ